MLPVSLRFNIIILHLFLFTLIPKHTPKKKEKIKIPNEQISFTRTTQMMVPPEHETVYGI